MKITKDIWVLLTEYDDLNQVEIVLYKNNNGLKPYLYYTNDTDAALLKMDENEFLFFVKIDIKKNSEFKFAIVGDGDIVKYEIYLGNTSEECHMVKQEKYVAPVLANNKRIIEEKQEQESINDKNVNIKDIFEIFDINSNNDDNEEIYVVKDDTADSIIEDILDYSIEEKNIIEKEEFEENVGEEIEEDIKIIEKEGLSEENSENNLKATVTLDEVNEDKKENNSIFDDRFLSFQSIIDTIDKFDFSFGNTDISILKDEKNDFNENKILNNEEIKVNENDTSDIEEIKVNENDTSDNEEIRVNENDTSNTEEIETIDNEILNTEEIKVIEDEILNTEEIEAIDNEISNTEEIKVIEDEILNIEETNANVDEISNNVEIIINKNETLSNEENIQEKNKKYDSQLSNIEQEEKSLIVQSDKSIKKSKRKGLSFGYKMNKKIKIALIKIYRLMPNFIKGDYRRRINL